MIKLPLLTKELTNKNSITEHWSLQACHSKSKEGQLYILDYLSWIRLSCLPCHCLCSSLLHRSIACWSRSHARQGTWGRRAPRHTPPDTEPWCYMSGLRSSTYGSSRKGWPRGTNRPTCFQFVSWASRRHVSAWNRTDQGRLLIEF